MVLARLLAEHRCLSEVMYYEARGEGEDGQKAVAEVVFHRMNTGNYGHSICAVVYEGVGTGTLPVLLRLRRLARRKPSRRNPGAKPRRWPRAS